MARSPLTVCATLFGEAAPAKVLRRNGEGEPACLVVRSRSGLLLFPFLQRPIDADLIRSAGPAVSKAS